MSVFKSEIIHEETVHDLDDNSISIIHFNDVYNIESNNQEPVGGAARFITALESLISMRPSLVFFSGDALSPSNISMIVKGKQMIEVLNKCHIAAACLGNHDFDFGLDVLINHICDSKFEWLLSNVFDSETKKPLGNVENKKVIEFNGFRIGVIALVEQEWITTLSTISYDEIIYKSYVDEGRRLAIELKGEDKCDLVIALTHMRWNNDTHLAEKVPEIDLFLGGHDHDYGASKINEKWVIKSGTDFRELSVIDFSVHSKRVNKIEKIKITSSIQENLEIKELVESYMKDLNAELEVILGYMNVELEGRFSYVRTQETNLGNFISDILLTSVTADCAMLNSGSFRSDLKHERGEFKVRDLKKILPFLDEAVVISVTGDILLKALENSVSQYPKHEGRFCQVAGMKFAFDPHKPSGQRIDPRLVQIQEENLDLKKEYVLVTKSYMKQGKDGFDMFVDCPVLIEEENLPVLFQLVVNHFKSISNLKRGNHRFRQSIVPLITVNRLINNLSQDPEILKKKSQESPNKSPTKMNFHNAVNIVSKILHLYRTTSLSRKDRITIKESEQYKLKMKEYEEKSMKLEPMVENRIVCIKNEEHYHELLKAKNHHESLIHDLKASTKIISGLIS